jgi:hypothetical protein
MIVYVIKIIKNKLDKCIVDLNLIKKSEIKLYLMIHKLN